MHRFFLDPTCIRGTTVTFPEATARQIRNVLRMTPEEQVVVLDDSGDEFEVRLVAVTGRQVMGEVVAQRPCPTEPELHLTLYQALLKRDKFEWVLQKGTEIGVSRFVPLVTERSVVTAVRPNKMARWGRIVTEAAEQCGRGRLPAIEAPHVLTNGWPDLNAELTLLPWVEAEVTTVRTALNGRKLRSMALLVGPEGGWSPAEVAAAQGQGAVPITLGPRTLRAETAALVAAALALHEAGALG